MKHLFVGIIFATLLATVFVSCRKGDKGDPGPAGTSGALLPYKDGSITGTLSGTKYQADESFTQNLNFKYFYSPSENSSKVNGSVTHYSITRYDSVGSSYITLDFDFDYYFDQNTNTSVPEIYNVNATIVTNTKESNSNNLFYFGTTTDYTNPFNVGSIYLSDYSSGGNSNITYSNLVVNSTTGLLSFDYSLELGYYDNSTGSLATMDGTVSLTPYNVTYREGAQ